LQRLMRAYRYELVLMGFRAHTIAELTPPAGGSTGDYHSIEVDGIALGNLAFRQRPVVPQTIAGGRVDPFVNAFLTSPTNNSPFEHDLGPASRGRFDGKVDLTYAFSDNVALSLPLHVETYRYDGSFPADSVSGSTPMRLTVEPALVLNVGKYGSIAGAYVRVGQLDNLQSSRMGLAYRATDATQQGPGFQNPVQPYENGIDIGGIFGKRTSFQLSFAQLDQSAVETFPGSSDSINDNYFLVVRPPRTSQIQTGQPISPIVPTRTDTYIASGGPVTFVYLSQKAGIGTVYISSIDGTVCTSAGLTPLNAPCPIHPGQWYYIDGTNQVVFTSPLPVGSVVQISYAASGGGGQFERDRIQYARYHFSARINHEIAGIPGAQMGLSISRVFDSGNVRYNTGYGLLSDTVYGLDARIPLAFIRMGPGRAQHPDIFAEVASSKYTPDRYNTSAITDGAMVVGLRLNVAGARASVQYQAVGPDFMDGGPLRFFGPSPQSFQSWRAGYFPEFFGFANNIAINKTFATTITPGCVGTNCADANANLTYIYPVFNPFHASGPQFFSAFAPNSRGLTTNFSAPFGHGADGLNARVEMQHLQEMAPNSDGQIQYGPGFASSTRLSFDKLLAGVRFGAPLFGRSWAVDLNASTERLYRKDMTAYSYVPFNILTGGPDASLVAALNAYLSMPGNTPILFYPNYVDERHTSFDLGVTLPVAQSLDLGLNFDAQAYRGSYGTTLGENISQRKNTSIATLSYNIPRSRSSLTLVVGMQRYFDNVLSTYNYSQNREDVDYTIRF
ncbi:MAG: hypothetical protein M3R30_01565, partial [Candidatus Eremiobacteraeota bacterium]|nr:hypothetical protein [Candidatus Eremiobacteraeota bacterium]